VPGWGHASIGSYTRAGFYFTAETTTAWMLFRTVRRLHAARERVAFRDATVRQELAAQGVSDPTELTDALNADETLTDLKGLVDARSSQREDWIALGLFTLLLSGADAFVSAHLANFPTPITIEGQPVADGRFEVGVKVALPRPGSR